MLFSLTKLLLDYLKKIESAWTAKDAAKIFWKRKYMYSVDIIDRPN